MALAAVGNIVLHFMPQKMAVSCSNLVGQLVQLAQSPKSMMRLNAVWALKNLLFMADKMVRDTVMTELTASVMVGLLFGMKPLMPSPAAAYFEPDVCGSASCNFFFHSLKFTSQHDFLCLQTGIRKSKSKPWLFYETLCVVLRIRRTRLRSMKVLC